MGDCEGRARKLAARNEITGVPDRARKNPTMASTKLLQNARLRSAVRGLRLTVEF